MLPDHLNTFIFKSALPQLKGMYPNALDFGADYVHFLLKKVHTEGVEPHIAVSFSMLDKGNSAENYESGIMRRNRNPQDLSAEITGYVKSTILLVGFFLVVDKILPEFGEVSEEDIQKQLSFLMPHVVGFGTLPRDLQASSMAYVNQNINSVLDEALESDNVDVMNLMRKIAIRAERDNSNELYQRGVRTARDTFSLYFELISRIPTHWYR